MESSTDNAQLQMTIIEKNTQIDQLLGHVQMLRNSLSYMKTACQLSAFNQYQRHDFIAMIDRVLDEAIDPASDDDDMALSA